MKVTGKVGMLDINFQTRSKLMELDLFVNGCDLNEVTDVKEKTKSAA